MIKKLEKKLAQRNDFVSKFLLKILSDNSVIYQFLRYCVVGGIAFVFDYGFLQISMFFLPNDWKTSMEIFGSQLDISVMIATAIGFVVGLIVNYLMSLFFVFTAEGDKEKGQKLSAIIVFVLVGIIGLILTEIGMQVGANMFGTQAIALFIVKIVVTLIVLVWNYLGRRILIFK